MKVTFIQPYYSNIWESLGIGSIISYCQKNYNGNLDIYFKHENFDRFLFSTDTLYSDIIGLSCTTPTFQRGVQIAKVLKSFNPKIHIVMGGWHTTTTGENPDESVIDQIVIGEGESAFLDILNGDRDPIIYGKMLDFKKLPWPSREIIDLNNTLNLCQKITGGLRIGSFQSRRGCMNSCTMCGENCMTSNNIRVRDPKDVLDEIDHVRNKYNINYFKFVDPTWCYPKSYVKDFCEEYLERNKFQPWEAMCHAAYLDDEILDMLKTCNCKQINIGVESGDQKVLNAMKKGITVQKIKKVFKYGNKIGLDMRAFFMIGFPEEDEHSHELTKELIREIKPSVFGMTILCPYPGTKYYDKEKYKNVDWSKQGEYSNSIWKTKNFSNKRLKEIQKEFNEEFKDILVGHQK